MNQLDLHAASPSTTQPLTSIDGSVLAHVTGGLNKAIRHKYTRPRTPGNKSHR